jgi:ferric-dicitrate binding protein FerR (iron transport regulator)
VTEVVPPSTGNGYSEPAILSLVLRQLELMEHRLLVRFDEQAQAAKERWTAHDQQHIDWEKEIKALRTDLNRLRQSEHDEAVAFDARVRPIKTLAGTIRREWRTIMLASLFIAGWITQILENLKLHT